MEIKARIPGTVVAVNVQVGDSVKTRGVLGVMEAMKMEQPIACPVDGVVKEIRVSVETRLNPARF